MVDLSLYCLQTRLANRVYAASLAAEERGRGARPPLKFDPELMSLKCGRALWFGLKGLAPRSAGGGQARTLERGRLARRAVARDLRRAGFRVEWVGALECGRIYGLTRRPLLLEVQPVPEATFQRLKKFGLGAAINLEIALHCRLGFAGMDRALFVAENKNSQELYFEKVCFDQEIFDQARARASEVTALPEAPPVNFDESCARCRFRAGCGEGLSYQPGKSMNCLHGR